MYVVTQLVIKSLDGESVERELFREEWDEEFGTRDDALEAIVASADEGAEIKLAETSDGFYRVVGAYPDAFGIMSVWIIEGEDEDEEDEESGAT